MSAEKIIELYVKSTEIIDFLTASLDYKKHNREVDKLIKLETFLKEDLELSKIVCGTLLKFNCITTKTYIAANCLRQGIYVEEAEKILEELSKRTDIGIRRFNAEMILRVWRGEVPGSKL